MSSQWLTRPEWTMVPNILLDNLGEFTNAELRVMLAAIRQTLGYHREAPQPMSKSYLEKRTGLSSYGVRDGVIAAKERGWLIESDTTGKRGVKKYQVRFGDSIDKKSNQSPPSSSDTQIPLSEIPSDPLSEIPSPVPEMGGVKKGNKESIEKKKDYDNYPTDSNREESSPALEPNPAQLILLQALTRRWIKSDTLQSKGIHLIEQHSCLANGWIEKKRSYDYIVQFRLTESGKAIKSPAKQKTDPGVQAANRALADELAAAMNVKPVGKDYGNFIKVAKDLLDAGIIANRFPDYVRYVRQMSARQGGWDVTVNSLTANGRMSEYMSRLNPRYANTDHNAPIDMGRIVAEPTPIENIDKYGQPIIEEEI